MNNTSIKVYWDKCRRKDHKYCFGLRWNISLEIRYLL